MPVDFKDHFSENPEEYGKYRPEYPAGLFASLASISPATESAWDCATGTGQAARGLKKFFSKVVATDASAAQIEKAERAEGIRYLVAPAERTGIKSREIDLITVAQALHWFDLAGFFAEAERVLKPGGILAVWSYNLLRVNPDIDPIIDHFYGAVLGRYWPKERALVEQGYDGIQFPFMEISPPVFAMGAEWNLDQLVGYLGTWSAVGKFRQQRGADPITDLREELARNWGKADGKLAVRWPLSLNIRQKEAEPGEAAGTVRRSA